MKYILLAVFIVSQLTAIAQAPSKEPQGGGSYQLNATVSDEMSPEKRNEIISMLQVNEARLKQQGKLPETLLQPAALLFSWPIRQAAGVSDNGFYGISNYVDENNSYPNAVLDYNCGTRSYDLSNGYNHPGTDIFTWPFPWQKMVQNAVEIVAAAPGIIIGKTDNNADTSCSMCTSCDWNAVYIRHLDGSVAWYGHMKKNSQTSKALGDAVAEGEVLGIVGSAGSSTGPHLHFEVYTNSAYTQLVDPWAGPCNNHNGNTSWWANQQPYRVSTLNKIMTHGAPPVTGCFSQEAVNGKTNFVNGETIYLGSYYRDQLTGQQSIHTIYRPDNSVFSSWSQNFTNTYDASWWWYSIALPNPAPGGTWRYTITYNNSQTLSTSFGVNSSLPVELTSFTARKNGEGVDISFTTSKEENIVHYKLLRSSNGVDFKDILTIPAKNNLLNTYTATDNSPLAASNYYKLEIDEKDGLQKYSTVQRVSFDGTRNYLKVAGNPFSKILRITILQSLSDVSFELVNFSGQVVYSKYYSQVRDVVELDTRLSAGVYLLVMKSNNVVVDKCTVIGQ